MISRMKSIVNLDFLPDYNVAVFSRVGEENDGIKGYVVALIEKDVVIGRPANDIIYRFDSLDKMELDIVKNLDRRRAVYVGAALAYIKGLYK